VTDPLFTATQDDGFIVVEWTSREEQTGGYDWRLMSGESEVNALDTYTATASLGELSPGRYELLVSPKTENSASGEFAFKFAVTDKGLVTETEIRLAQVLDRVGALIHERDELEARLAAAIDDLQVAQKTIRILELELERLRALGSEPEGERARRAWRALASPSVASVLAIVAIASGGFFTIRGAQIQAEATRQAAEFSTATYSLEDELQLCLENTGQLLEILRSGGSEVSE
jgi:hypothetical protein